jgi:hypothetical protein
MPLEIVLRLKPAGVVAAAPVVPVVPPVPLDAAAGAPSGEKLMLAQVFLKKGC